MDKIKLTGQNLGRVFNSRLGHAVYGAYGAAECITKQPNFKLETWPEQLLGSLHRDKTRVQMPAKIFPHLKVKC